MVNDAISDFLARLKNAVILKRAYLELPHTKFIYELTKVLKEEGFFVNVKKFKEGKREKIRVGLAPDNDGEEAFHVFRRLSKPGRRLYRSARQLRPFSKGGILTIISTSRGLMTIAKARKLSLGGELVCTLQ